MRAQRGPPLKAWYHTPTVMSSPQAMGESGEWTSTSARAGGAVISVAAAAAAIRGGKVRTRFDATAAASVADSVVPGPASHLTAIYVPPRRVIADSRRSGNEDAARMPGSASGAPVASGPVAARVADLVGR